MIAVPPLSQLPKLSACTPGINPAATISCFQTSAATEASPVQSIKPSAVSGLSVAPQIQEM